MAATPGSGAGRRLSMGALIVVLGVLYLLTATWSQRYNVDAFTNAVQARAFAEDQSPILEEVEGLTDPKYQGTLAWFVDSPGGPTSQYPPGVGVWGALFYVLDTSTETQVVAWADEAAGTSGEVELVIPSFAPAALAAAASVLIAMYFFGRTLRDHIGERRALVAVAAAGLGTGAWSVASDKLWQHGPGMMCISIGTYFASRNRFFASGLAFGGALLIRPHTAVIPAAVGLVVALRRKELRPLIATGLGSGIGMLTLVLYNNAVFGALSITGGYGSDFNRNMENTSMLLLGKRIVLAFVDPTVGVFVSSPFLIIGFVGLVGLVRKRGSAPDWAVGAAVGAAAYMVLQLWANRVSGGSGFYGYRYPLEPLMAAAPLLALATVNWVNNDEKRVLAFKVLAGLGILMHAYGAVLYR